jgi:hypothetical protein
LVFRDAAKVRHDRTEMTADHVVHRKTDGKCCDLGLNRSA